METSTKTYRVIQQEKYWLVNSPATGHIQIPRDGRWTFNGDFEKPTFSPSINETFGKPGQTHEEMRADPNVQRSHCFIRDGKIEYLGDCTHSYAGQTVDIPPLNEAEVSRYFGDSDE
jgi:hypothetical protein